MRPRIALLCEWGEQMGANAKPSQFSSSSQAAQSLSKATTNGRLSRIALRRICCCPDLWAWSDQFDLFVGLIRSVGLSSRNQIRLEWSSSILDALRFIVLRCCVLETKEEHTATQIVSYLRLQLGLKPTRIHNHNVTKDLICHLVFCSKLRTVGVTHDYQSFFV